MINKKVVYFKFIEKIEKQVELHTHFVGQIRWSCSPLYISIAPSRQVYLSVKTTYKKHSEVMASFFTNCRSFCRQRLSTKEILVIPSKFGKCTSAQLVDGIKISPPFQSYTKLLKDGKKEHVFKNSVLLF